MNTSRLSEGGTPHRIRYAVGGRVKGAQRKISGCFKEVSRVLQERFKGVSKNIEGCLKAVSKTL